MLTVSGLHRHQPSKQINKKSFNYYFFGIQSIWGYFATKRMTRVVYIFSARSISAFRNSPIITESIVGYPVYCRIGRAQGPRLRGTKVRQVRRVMISNYGMKLTFYSILHILISILRRHIRHGFTHTGTTGTRYLPIYSLYTTCIMFNPRIL